MAKRLRENSISQQNASFSEATESHIAKYAELDDMSNGPKDASQSPGRSQSTTMQCLLPPHKPLKFSTYIDYERHYTSSHTNRCRECLKNLPSSHFLELHIAENHDPIVSARRGRGEKTYPCFVETCDKICLDWKKRRSHLVDKHGFPKNYDFFIVNDGIDGRRSMLRPGIDADGHRKSSRERERRDSSATATTQTTEATSVAVASEEGSEGVVAKEGEGAVDKESVKGKGNDSSMDEVTKSMSSLQFVPRSVTFGKRKGKSGFAKS